MGQWWSQWSAQWSQMSGTTLWMSVQVILILLAAIVLSRLVRLGLVRLGRRLGLPEDYLGPLRGLLRWLILLTAGVLIMERLGVSATTLWAAISGFVALVAIAFFALWSVLSNILCAFFLLASAPFRLGDRIELVETLDKPIARGRVRDMSLFFTTLEDQDEAGERVQVQIPNALFFQKTLRRYRGQRTTHLAQAFESPMTTASQKSDDA